VPKTVREIMEAGGPTVAPGDDVDKVLKVMREHELPGVPVVNDGGRCVGIVTEADLVLPDDDGDLHLPHYVNIFGGTVFIEPLSRFEDRLRKAFASKAQDMMTEDPDTIDVDASVEDAARLIHGSGHNRLPVVEHGRFVGVVTRLDVLGALVS
jgi:CBS domain-containing protein